MKRFLVISLAASFMVVMGCGTGSKGERQKQTDPLPQVQSQEQYSEQSPEQSVEPQVLETTLSITVPTGIYLTPTEGRLIEVSRENEAIIRKVKNQHFKKNRLKREIARLFREHKQLTAADREKFKQENQIIADEMKALEDQISAMAYDSFSFELFRKNESDSYQVRYVQWIQDEAWMIDVVSEAVVVNYNEETGHLSFTVKDGQNRQFKIEGHYAAETRDGFPVDVIYGQVQISDPKGQTRYKGKWRAERQLTDQEEKVFLEKTAPSEEKKNQ